MLIHRPNITNEFLTEEIEKPKKNWLKKDKIELERLKKQSQKLEIEKEKASDIYSAALDKYNKNETKIDKLVGKYTYIKKVKVKNPYYDPTASRYEPA